MEKYECICCKKEREGQWIFFNEKCDDRLVWICNICNYKKEEKCTK
jgi:hypothetical protein